MDNASDKKPLLPSNSSRASGEGSTKESKFDSKTDTKTESNKETNKDSKKESIKDSKKSKKESIKDSKKSKKEIPPASGGGNGAPTRIIRPTVQARPFSTKTKGVYWIFTILHLVILLSVLFAISYCLLLFVFAQTKYRPLYFGKGSFIGGVPAVMYEPIDRDKEAKKGVISFKPESINTTYAKYLKRLREVMDDTEITLTRNISEDCNEHRSHLMWTKTQYKDNGNIKGIQTNTSCYLSYELKNKYTEFCGENMGYSTGKPCLLIRLTKILGFFPSYEEKDNKNDKAKAQNLTMENACGGTINFTCTVYENEKKTKERNITMKKLPNDGIPFCHFPFWNKTNYIAPYIMIQPISPLPYGQKTVIECVPDLPKLKTLSNGRKNEVTITVDLVEDSNAITNGTATTTEKSVNNREESTKGSEEKVTTPIPTAPTVNTDNKDTVTTTEIPTTSTVNTE